ncbi:tetraacyldisaccharide 4'-kinase [Arenimonas sp.]|uniref:tetraacyldisaccharide 4'-kinase n=1 Tax=Arenimonas sp. TaxID=1872635 RepID=UPI0039E5DAC0
MAGGVEAWLQRRWYGGVPPNHALRFAAGMYRIVTDLRRTAYGHGWMQAHKVPARVIVIGNFTAGGTGKTPLILALAERLRIAGWRPAIVSRGHGRQSRAAVRVDAATPASECGDEPKLLYERSGLPVYVDADRVAACRRAITEGCDIVLADDGLQHHRLRRDIEIEVIDGERRYGNGLMLPAGPLREKPRRVDWRVVNGGQAQAGEWPMSLRLAGLRSLGGDAACDPSAFLGCKVHAVAGIGNPQRFFSALRRLGLDIVEHAFPDHHRFETGDFAGMDAPILMTEKDAVKCRALGLEGAWYAPVAAELPDAFYSGLCEALQAPQA